MSKKPKIEIPAGLNLSRPEQPRWAASPRLRRMGFTSSVALRHANGDYMTPGQAFDAAAEINRMVADVDAGLTPTGPWAHIAPKGALLAGVQSPRAIGALIDAFVGIPAPHALAEPDPKNPALWSRQPSEAFQDLADDTRREYRGRLKRLVEVLARQFDGDPARLDLPAAARISACAAYEAKTTQARAMDVMELLADSNPLLDRYKAMCAIINPRTGNPTVHNANRVFGVASAWLKWVMDQRINGKRIIPFNPAHSDRVPRTASAGRINPWPATEFARLCAQAVKDGWLSIARSSRMARELSWSQKDILALTYGQFRAGIAYDPDGNPYDVVRVKGTRSKTNVTTTTTLTREGTALFYEIKAAWQAAHGGDGVEPHPATPLFVVDDIPGRNDRGAVGKPWDSQYYQHKFIEVKLSCTPPITAYTFQDLRDTAFTEAMEGGLDEHEIRSRTQHASAESVRQLGSKHYGQVTTRISDRGARKLDDLRARQSRSND